VKLGFQRSNPLSNPQKKDKQKMLSSIDTSDHRQALEEIYRPSSPQSSRQWASAAPVVAADAFSGRGGD
jgi:hypothetical protein